MLSPSSPLRFSTGYPLDPYLAFPRRIYLLRALALALAFLMMAAVLAPRDAPWTLWLGPALHAFAWPHLAWRLCLRSRQPNRTAIRNLLVDHLLLGMWAPLLGFNLLVCAACLAVLGMTAMSGGGARLAVRGLLFYLCGVTLGLFAYGIRWDPRPTLPVLLASLPFLVAVPAAFGHISRAAIERLRRKRDELERRSWYDGLSGLFNRGHWEAAVRTEFARCRRTGQSATLVLVDLDHFKKVNDLYGHEAGDQAICGFAALLREHLRDFDVPARYGGEEFGILLPHTSPSEAREVVNRLRQQLHASPLLHDFRVTASFGIAGLTSDIGSHSEWIRLTDRMLYTAKHGGRDRIVECGGENRNQPPPAESKPLRPLMSSRDPAILSRLLQGIDVAESPVAMFDPTDRLVMANTAYLRMHDLPPGVDNFADIIRSVHARKTGPVIDADSAEEWLQRIYRVRRTRPRHSFHLDTHDGQQFRGVEICFDDGWILTTLIAPETPVAY